MSIKAIDWCYYSDIYYTVDNDFPLIDGEIVGMVVKETDEYIAIAHQLFEDGKKTRHVTSIPKVTIKEIIELEICKCQNTEK